MGKKLKITIGVILFIGFILAILTGFVLSVGILFNIIIDTTFFLALFLGPLLTAGLICLLVMLFSNGKVKWTFLIVGIIAFVFGIIDLGVFIFSSHQRSVPLPEFAIAQSDNHVFANYTPPSNLTTVYDNEEKYFQDSDTLGYMPVKNKKTNTYELFGDNKIFNVYYTIDRFGHRIAPPFYPHRNAKSILFFGCSVTFGYGLADDETTPFKVGLKTNGKYKIYNFSFNGYGTHQMVSAFEKHLVDTIVRVPPAHIFYIATPMHIDWIKNRKNWGRHDPMYDLDSSNVVYKGHFDEIPEEIVKSFLFDCKMNYEKLRLKSYTLQILDPVENNFNKTYLRADQDLFVALVLKAKALAKAKYPDAKFHVIMYWSISKEDRRIIDLFRQNEVDHYLVEDLIPDYKTSFEKYAIKHPVDPHPNAVANEFLADLIVDDIIKVNDALK